MKSSIHHFYTEKDIKKEYKFWETQLVPKFNENNSDKLGPIKSEIKYEDISKEPIELPEKDMEWVLIDINKKGELEKIYNFLIKNYYEVQEYKEQYSFDFLKWQFSPIENNPHKNILLSIQKKGKIIGFFSGLPLKLSVYGKEILTYNISFLCIDSDYRHKKLAEYMFKEMFRRSYLEKVFQNIFVSKLLIPKPFAECTYYYANVKDKVKKYKLKKKSSDKFRLMEKKDVKDVYNLISNSQKQFKIYSIFSEEEIEHWFIPIKNVIYSFVKEDENNNITDFTSFYVVNALIDNMKEKWCYIYFNIATSMSSEKLFENALVLAEQSGIDYYIGNSINNYEYLLKKYKFGSNLEEGDLSENLKYYFNNFICPETESKDISIILI
jgi:glycylpeptide N-tetradecanoyltransferase